MKRQNIDFKSTTRPRDYIGYLFGNGSMQEKEFFFTSLTKTPYVAYKKIFFTPYL